MPKAPILSREMFYTRQRDGSFRFLDWNLVNTSLGAMMELRTFRHDGGKATDIDAIDAGFTSIREFDENQMFALMGSYGPQWPTAYNV